jgi:hypothetical protein
MRNSVYLVFTMHDNMLSEVKIKRHWEGKFHRQTKTYKFKFWDHGVLRFKNVQKCCWIALNLPLTKSYPDINRTKCLCCRFQWPCSLRCGSAAARLLGLRIRIPQRTWMSLVSVVCCQVVVSASGRSLVQRSPIECGVSECDLETSTTLPTLAVES